MRIFKALGSCGNRSKSGPDVLMVAFTCFREKHSSLFLYEKLDAQVVLKRCNLATDSRLTNEQLGRSSGKTSLPSDAFENAQWIEWWYFSTHF